jgi:hypothetical protein
MTELSPRARDLFARARASATPTAAERARVLERVERAVTPSVAPPAPSAALPAIGVGVLVVLATVLSMIGTPRPPEPARAVVDPPPAPIAAPLPAIASPSAPTIEPPEPSPIAAVPMAAASPAPERDPLTEELLLLRRAQASRRAHRYAGALAALREHARRFPDGTLASERDVARALVLCESGRLEEGRALAVPFAGSAWAASLDEACTDSIDSSEAP